MKTWIFFFWFPLHIFSQNFWTKDSIPNCKKTWLLAGTSLGVIGGLYTYTGISWYSNIPKTKFHFFDDSKEWKQMDKVGHSWTAYQESKMINELMIWAGYNRGVRGITTALAGFTFQLPLEYFDGYTEKWGASVTDIIANASGSLLAAANVWAFDKQLIQLKFSFHPTIYSKRFPNLFGTGISTVFKDYNGQAYWLCIDMKELFFSQTKFPKWLNFSLGYGAQGLEGGYGKTDKSILQLREFRQWYLAPDINFSKIRTQKAVIKILFFVLDTIHFPLPALEYNKHHLRWHWIYF